jgi:hypothetical protein
MGKYDKDRFLKELAVRLCLARGMLPFLEVVVSSTSDLSDTPEVLTDLDVLGLQLVYDGGIRRTIFDCRSLNKMSAINRAFWAAGIMRYTSSDDSHVILKHKAVDNHRLSALSIAVDLHDENSFRELGNSYDPGFEMESKYQSSIDRWNDVYDCFIKNGWSEPLFLLSRNITPLSQEPWNVFRRFVATLRDLKGHFDPAKNAHLAIYLDVLSSCFVLWTTRGRDIRRFYDPKMGKKEFESILRYYIWGGKESYIIRKQLREKIGKDGGDAVALDLPSWEKLVSFVGFLIEAPQHIFVCADVCREISIRTGSVPNEELDKGLSESIKKNRRVRQYTLALSDYLVSAAGLPKDLGKRVGELVLAS